MQPKQQRDDFERDEAAPEVPRAEAEVTDLPAHLLKTRLRIAVESLEAAERLLRAHGAHPDADFRDAQVLVDNARRELESLKALLRGDTVV